MTADRMISQSEAEATVQLWKNIEPEIAQIIQSKLDDAIDKRLRKLLGEGLKTVPEEIILLLLKRGLNGTEKNKHESQGLFR